MADNVEIRKVGPTVGNPIVATDERVIGGQTVQVQITSGQSFTTRIDVVGTVTYIGEANPGTTAATAAWRIKRISESGQDAVVEWADGDDAFDNVWDDRAILTYS